MSPAQRGLLWALAALATFVLANSLYLFVTGKTDLSDGGAFALPTTYQSMLLGHLGIGLLVVGLALFFAAWHLRRALRRRTKGAVPTGIVVVGLLVVLLVTGLLILSEANSRENAWAFLAHQIAALLIPAAYLFHRLRSKSRPSARQIGRAIITTAAITLGLFLVHWIEVAQREAPKPYERERPTLDAAIAAALPIADPFLPFVGSADPDPKSPFFPSLTTTRSGKHAPADLIHGGDVPAAEARAKEIHAKGFVSDHEIGTAACKDCHPDIVAQWAASAHRFASLNNPFYTSSVDLTREVHGTQRTRWCAGCHDPALLLPGTLDNPFDPTESDAQTGITCTTCHLIDDLHGTAGNGGFRLDDQSPSPYLFADQDGFLGDVYQYLLKARPHAHRKRMKKSFFETSEYCASCHKVSLESFLNDYKWLRGQNQYDGWHDTGVAHNNPMTWYEPPTTRTCQDCHMPPEAATRGDVSAQNGMVKSHRFLGANTALPALRGDKEMLAMTEHFLQDNRIKVTAWALRHEDGRIATAIGTRTPQVKPGEIVQLDVIVRNRDVGHTFPAGTNDSNEGWLEVQIDQGERSLWHHGAVQANGDVDPAAHFYRAVLIDVKGNKIDRRNPLDIHTAVYANVIGPSTSDIVRYRFRIPEDAAPGPIKASVKLQWRKFNAPYKRFSLPHQPDFKQPITTMAEHTVTLQVSATEASTIADPPADQWMSLNDWGIGSVMDGDSQTAKLAFEGVTRLVPEKVDGWRNLARVALRDGNLAEAEKHLRKAVAIAPGEARTSFFWGVLLEERGGEDLERAAEAYRATVQHYPRSRQTLDRLANVYWLLGDDLNALKTALKVLEIDPEHLRAHYHRMRAYKRLAKQEQDAAKRSALEYAAAEAEKAWIKYKVDEDAQEATLSYRQKHPHDQRMSQSITVHEQAELR